MFQNPALNPTIARSRKQLAQASGLMALELLNSVQAKVVQACKEAGWADRIWLAAGSDLAEMEMVRAALACCKSTEYLNLRSAPDRQAYLEGSAFIVLLNYLLPRVPLKHRHAVFYSLTSLYDKA